MTKYKGICPVCSVSFVKKRWDQNYCSPECGCEAKRQAAIEKREKNKKLLPPRICPCCNQEFHSSYASQKLCSDMCREQYVIRVSNEKWLSKTETLPRKRANSEAFAYSFFAIKTWYPKNRVFRG